MAKRTLGSVVKEARDEARMSQRELAAAIGVKASHIAYIENGHRKIPEPSRALSSFLPANRKIMLS